MRGQPSRAVGPGFFIKHLRGDYGLARAYWLHSVAFAWLLMYLAHLAFQHVGQMGPARYLSMAVLAFQPLALLVWTWSTVGTFMSAFKQVFGGHGSRFWAVVAIVSLSLGCIGMIRKLATMGPVMTAHWQVALGEQPGDAFTLEFRQDHRELVFTGGVNEGAAQALDKAIMSQLGTVNTLVLDSPGGWIGEGRRMAEVVRAHNLNTRVEKACMSSCTLVLLAGHERTAATEAQIGFHQARAIGEDRVAPTRGGRAGLARREERALYTKAGVTESFARRIVAVPFAQIWVPSHEELLKAQVLTR
ncbi:MAG: hypothetical protein EOP38_17780 [Rubrivivax sp.]|nr:MAG: hypothetical protein EOP38_17780 [Rubrivivax sp.]